MIASLFGGIRKNTHCKHALGIIIMIHHLKWRYGTRNDSICIVFRSVTLPFIRTLENDTFQNNNARFHVANIFRGFSWCRNWFLLPWSTYSPDLTTIEIIWLIAAQWLARHSTLVIAADELWHLDETHGSCTCNCLSVAVRFNTQEYNTLYCCCKLF